MSSKNREALRAKVVAAAEAALAKSGFVRAIDVLIGLGWLDAATEERWRKSQIAYLEQGVRANLSRLSEAMRMFRGWATERNLRPSETAYVARRGGRQALRFSKTGDPTIERLYRTHWVSPALSAKKERERPPPETEAPEGPEPREDAVPADGAKKLELRVTRAAEGALAREGFVTSIDVFTGIGWLDPATLSRWRQSQLPYLLQGLQTKPERVSSALLHLGEWAASKQLASLEAAYFAKTPSHPALRFTEAGDEGVERGFRTLWLSPALSTKARERIEREATAPPELVVIQPLDEWTCHRCGGTGDLLIMDAPGPSCLPCAGLGGLVFLPAGDAGASRRAKAKSATHAVVVRFSRARKRYERQGLMVEPGALSDAEGELEP